MYIAINSHSSEKQGGSIYSSIGPTSQECLLRRLKIESVDIDEERKVTWDQNIFLKIIRKSFRFYYNKPSS